MISVKCNIILGIFFLLVVESVRIKTSQSAYPTLRPPPLPDLPDPEEDTFPTLDGQSRAAFFQTMPRVDSRNNFDMFHPIPVARPKRCNKRIRIANGVTRFRERGSMVRYACSHGFTLIGAPLAVCLRDQWSEPPPICTRPGCRRILTPSNGLARLLYAGAVVAFFCESQYNLEGSRVLFCDGNRWNATEPVCIPKDPPTTTEVWEWPAQRLGESDDESWDYNNPDAATTEDPISNTTEKIQATSPKVTQQSASTTKTMPVPAILVTEAENATMPMLKTTSLPQHRLETTLNMPETTEKTSMKSFPSSNSTTQRPTIPTTTTSKPVFVTTMVTSTKRSTTQQTTPTRTRSRTTKTPTITTTSSTTTTTSPILTSIVSIPHQSREVIYVTVPESKTTTESWEPFPGHTFNTFDEGLIYESATPAPEFIQPLKPISPDKLNDDEYYKKVAHLSIVGGIVLGSLGIIFFVGGVATYCWRKNIGIARANAYDIDGRTLSASEANDDFTWMDPIRDPTHTDSRL